jgi:hypothetical protein
MAIFGGSTQETLEHCSKDVHVALWDNAIGKTSKLILRHQFPPAGTSTNGSKRSDYFRGHSNPKKSLEKLKAFLKVRLVTSELDFLPIPFKKLGQEMMTDQCAPSALS